MRPEDIQAAIKNLGLLSSHEQMREAARIALDGISPAATSIPLPSARERMIMSYAMRARTLLDGVHEQIRPRLAHGYSPVIPLSPSTEREIDRLVRTQFGPASEVGRRLAQDASHVQLGIDASLALTGPLRDALAAHVVDRFEPLGTQAAQIAWSLRGPSIEHRVPAWLMGYQPDAIGTSVWMAARREIEATFGALTSERVRIGADHEVFHTVLSFGEQILTHETASGIAVPAAEPRRDETTPAGATASRLHVVEGDAAARGEQLLDALTAHAEQHGLVLLTGDQLIELNRRRWIRDIANQLVIGLVVGAVLLLPSKWADKAVSGTPSTPQMDYPQPAPTPKIVPFCAPRQERRADLLDAGGRGGNGHDAEDCDSGMRRAA